MKHDQDCTCHCPDCTTGTQEPAEIERDEAANARDVAEAVAESIYQPTNHPGTARLAADLLAVTDGIPEPIPADTRPPMPVFPETWAVQVWQWLGPHEPSLKNQWFFMVHTCRNKQDVDNTVARNLDLGRTVVGVVRIPGGAA